MNSIQVIKDNDNKHLKKIFYIYKGMFILNSNNI